MPVYKDNTAYIDLPGGIDMAATFECGQAFRWKPAGPNAYEGAAGRHWARIERTGAGISIAPCDEALYEGFWRHYLDIDHDYRECVCNLLRDETMAPMAARCGGMRILNQPVWECLVSFLLSSNNNVKRISGIIERMCSRYGEDMGGHFAFPTAERLVEAGETGIRACGAGYRAAYVAGVAEAVLTGFDLDGLPGAGYEAAKAKLMELHGVGEKVADCVLLFSCGYREAFPVDVWVLRAMNLYFKEAGTTKADVRAFAAKRFGRLAGLAQQVMFHHERILGRSDQTGID